MEDVDRDLRLLGDANGEGNLLRLLEAFAADVGGVVAAVGRHRLRHGQNLIRVFWTAALEAGDQPPGALLHRPRHEIGHPLQLLRRGRTGVVAHDDAPDLLAGHVRDRVHRNPLPLQPLEVAREGRPVGRRTVAPLGRQAVTGSRRGALAGDIERDALADLALRRAVLDERHLRVRVEVDESGRDDQTGRVDDPTCASPAQQSDARDAIAPDAHVRSHRRRPGAIEHLTAADDDVEDGILRRHGRPGHQRQGEHRDPASDRRHRVPPLLGPSIRSGAYGNARPRAEYR